jgi:hypothetical protein
MTGIYIFGDLCSGQIFGLQNAGGWLSTPLIRAPFWISTFGEDAAGYLYVAGLYDGGIYRVEAELDLAQLTQKAYLPILSQGANP